MNVPRPNLMENPMKTHKSKAKGMSFFAFFCFVFYISIFYIFYIFSLSPSTLFSNTKFWFVISNTLILIIAADYGAFSSSKGQERDLYEEYALHSQARRSSTCTAAAAASASASASAASFVSQCPEIVLRESIGKDEQSLKQTKKEDEAEKMNEIPERILEVVKIEPETDNFPAKSQPEHPKEANNEACDQVINKLKKINEPKTIRRSKSDKLKRVTFNDKKNNLRRSKTEKYEPSAKENEIPGDEFSSMSDEELNRRVEEFIQKFNRQIRLQGVLETANFHHTNQIDGKEIL